MRSTILRSSSESYSIVASYSLRKIFTSVSSKLGVLTYPIYLLSKPDSPDNGCNNPISGAKVIKILHICKQRTSAGEIFFFFLLGDACLYMFFFFSFAYYLKNKDTYNSVGAIIGSLI